MIATSHPMSAGLAYKIGLFEAEARDDDWDVRTPRIPGIPPDDEP
jgi:hypothetical protein